MEATIKEIRLSAKKHFGECTFEFSQSLPPVHTIMGTDQATKNGICQALTNRWIADHANGGSMWNNIYLNVKGHECLDISGIRRLMVEQKAGGKNLFDQLMRNEMWLATQKVIPFENPVTKMYSRAGTCENIKTAATALADAILSTRSSDGHYLNLSMATDLTANAKGHAVAAFVGPASHSGKGDLLYFDSNFGEFWFKSKAHFKPWFLEMWEKIVMVEKQYKYKSWYLTAFAKRKGAIGKVD